MEGEIEIYLGPMFSGKTTKLFHELNRSQNIGLSGVFVKNESDTRYTKKPDEVITHNGFRFKTTPKTKSFGGIRVISAKRLTDVSFNEEEKVVAIDEGQFFEDLPEMADKWMREGRRVLIASLDGDFRRKLFGHVSEVIPLAKQVEKLTAYCMGCNQRKEAIYTIRMSEEKSQKMIGGKETYKAVCAKCFFKNEK